MLSICEFLERKYREMILDYGQQTKTPAALYLARLGFQFFAQYVLQLNRSEDVTIISNHQGQNAILLFR
jgi:hypothetical protein